MIAAQLARQDRETAAVEQFAARAIGVPFLAFGRDRDGWDCWGLVRRAHFEITGKALPDFLDEYDSPFDRETVEGLIQANTWRFRPVPAVAMRALDVAVLRIGGDECHVGLVIRPGQMLHVDRNVATCVEPLRSPRWRRRCLEADRPAGIWRYVG